MNEVEKMSLLTLSNPKDGRKELDFYPTPTEVTVALMEFLKLPPCKIWEPACGDGSMANVLKRYGHNVFSSDIRDSGYGVSNIDFLHCAPIESDAIITNPPFNVAHLFIKRAFNITNTVAMLLKSQYWHASTRNNLFKAYPPSWILPLTWRPDFLGGGSPVMECMWTVWQRGDIITKYQPLVKFTGQQELFI